MQEQRVGRMAASPSSSGPARSTVSGARRSPLDEPMLKECIVKEDGRRLCYYWFGERAEEMARRTPRAE